MKLAEVNWDPTNRQLRQFGAICPLALPSLGWLWGGDIRIISLLAIVGLLIAVGGLAWPGAIKPIFIALMVLATPVGMVIGELAMLLIYFGVFLPIGIIFRLMNRDALQLMISRESESYWQTKRQVRNISSYYRQS